MKFFKFVAFFALLIASFTTYAWAQGAQNNFASLMQQIASGSGPITREEYNSFWQKLGMTEREDKLRVIGSMKKNFLVLQQYQREVWRCAEQAWLTRMVPRCEKAQRKFKVIEAEMKKNGQKPVLKQMKDNSSRLLKAASERKDFKINDKTAPLPLTIETIRNTKENLEKMLGRFEQVLRVQY